MTFFTSTSEDDDFYLPDWYIFKRPPENMELDVEQWQEFAEKRLNRFLDITKGGGHGGWTLYRSTWMSDEDWNRLYAEELGGHYLLRLAVSRDSRLISWLVEVEGDLFEFRFAESISVNEKIAVLKDLFGSDNILSIEDINRRYNIDIYRKFGLIDLKSKYSRSSKQRKEGSTRRIGRDLEKRVAIKYYKIPDEVGAKKVLLYRGWAIVRYSTIKLSVKRAFEKKLKETIISSKQFLDNNPSLIKSIDPVLKKIKEASTHSRYKDLSKFSILGTEGIFTKLDCFPPCIYELIDTLRGKGHLAHEYNWQLGTFLKKVGMTIDEQLRFWYENSVDNLGQTFEEFESKIGYQIKHIYGKAGGGTDYDPPKCTTCIDTYYCYFAQKSLDEIADDIKRRFVDKSEEDLDSAIKDISQLISSFRYQEACARYFTLHTGWRLNTTRVSHMLQYTETAYKRFYGKKEKKIKNGGGDKNEQ